MELLDLMRDVDEYLGPSPDISPLPDGTTPQVRFHNSCQDNSCNFIADSRKHPIRPPEVLQALRHPLGTLHEKPHNIQPGYRVLRIQGKRHGGVRFTPATETSNPPENIPRARRDHAAATIERNHPNFA